MAKIRVENLVDWGNYSIKQVKKYDKLEIPVGTLKPWEIISGGFCDCEFCGKWYKPNYEVRSTPAADLWRNRICKPCLLIAVKEWTTLLLKHKLVLALGEHIENKILAEKLVGDLK